MSGVGKDHRGSLIHLFVFILFVFILTLNVSHTRVPLLRSLLCFTTDLRRRIYDFFTTEVGTSLTMRWANKKDEDQDTGVLGRRKGS